MIFLLRLAFYYQAIPLIIKMFHHSFYTNNLTQACDHKLHTDFVYLVATSYR